MNATHRSPLKLVKQAVGWNNAKEQICNQCTSRLSRYLWFTYESGGIFPTSSAVDRSRFSAGVAITNISMQLALLHSELDYLTYNWTSRHGTGYTFTWPRPTVEPLWYRHNRLRCDRVTPVCLWIWLVLWMIKGGQHFVDGRQTDGQTETSMPPHPHPHHQLCWRGYNDSLPTHICVTRPQWVYL